MTFLVDVIKEKSNDPDYIVNVLLYRDSVCINNYHVGLLRQPPGISFHYPGELREMLGKSEQQMLELEILNKVAEYIVETSAASAC